MSIEVVSDDTLQGPSTVTTDWSERSETALVLDAVRGVREAQEELERRIGVHHKATDADLVKVRRKALDRALAQLNEMERDSDGLIAVPWPQAARPAVPTDEWAWSELHAWVIDDLTATQATLDPDAVRWHLEHMSHVREGQSSYPNVLRTADGGLIYDGHHRLAALWLIGAVVSNCWTLEVEA